MTRGVGFQPGADLVITTPAADGIATLPRLIREAAADQSSSYQTHASLGSTNQIAETLDSLGLLLRQVEEHTYPDTLDADPRTASTASSNTASPISSVTPQRQPATLCTTASKSAYRELQTAGTA